MVLFVVPSKLLGKSCATRGLSHLRKSTLFLGLRPVYFRLSYEISLNLFFISCFLAGLCLARMVGGREIIMSGFTEFCIHLFNSCEKLNRELDLGIPKVSSLTPGTTETSYSR